LETVRAVKIYNLFIQQAALEFNMNFRALRCKLWWLLQKVLNIWLLILECVTVNPELIVTFSVLFKITYLYDDVFKNIFLNIFKGCIF